jgi:uncharacterized protein YjbI with pentapeptide repeats
MLFMNTLHKTIDELSHENRPLAEILEGHRKWLRGEGGERSNLRKANLIGVSLRGFYLIGADLSGAILVNADLKETSLIGTALKRTNLKGANLSGADLIGANLAQAILREADLSEADLRDANLNGAVLRECILDSATLYGASLRDANLAGTSLSQAFLKKADLTNANFSRANLFGADLEEADLSGANFADANLTASRLARAKLSGASLVKANLHGADLTEADFTGANLEGANLQDSNLKWSVLKQANLSCANLTGAYLEEANLGEWVIRGVICSFIRSGSEKEITRYGEGEFEKRFSFFKEILELVLKIPFTLSAVGVGKLIAQSTNAVLGSEVICLKGVEALARDSTKMSFFILDRDFYEGKARFFESYLRFALEDYFKEHPIREEPMCASYVLEQEWNVGIIQKDLAGRVSPGRALAEKTGESPVEDSFLEAGKIGEAVHHIVVSAFQ